MLSSITPLGQRGRGMSWSRSVIAFWVGAIGSGVVMFSTAGLVGTLIGLDNLNPVLSIVALASALILDLSGVRPPGPKRQVNENWLGRYRDWVVGLGFGAQLGFGMLTIVPSFGFWAVLLVAMSVGLPTATLIGAAFGLGRSLLLLSTRNVTSPTALADTLRAFAGAEGQARWLAHASYIGVIAIVSFNVL